MPNEPGQQNVAEALKDRGNALLRSDSLETSVLILDSAFSEALAAGDTALAALCINNVGVAYYYLGEYANCLTAYEQARAMYQQLGKRSAAAQTGFNMGILASEQAMYAPALEHLHAALDDFERTGSQDWLSRTYNALANLHGEIGAFDACLEYHRKALAIDLTLDSDEAVATSLNNLGHSFMGAIQYDSADYYVQQSYRIARGNGYNELTATTLYNLGLIALATKNTQLADSLAMESLRVHEYLNNGKGIANALALHAKAAVAANQAGSDLLLDLAIEKATEIGLQQTVLELKRTQLSWLRQQGRWQEAMIAYDDWAALNDTLRDQHLNEQLARQEVLFDTQRKERALAKVTEQARQKDVMLLYQRLALGAGGIAVALLVLFGALVYRSRIRERLLRKEAQHRIANNLQMLSTQIRILLRTNEHPEAQEAAGRIQGLVETVGVMQKKLFDDPTGRQVSVPEYVSDVVSAIVYVAESKKNPIEQILDVASMHIGARQLLYIGLMVNELVTNACKYAFGNHPAPKLYVSLQPLPDGKAVLVVRDNGLGSNSSGPSSGFGHVMLSKLVAQLKGTATVDSSNGFEYRFEFPIQVEKKKGAIQRLSGNRIS